MIAQPDNLESNTDVFTNVVLIGFMGSGKSSVGHLLATRLGLRFVDIDTLVVETTGLQITEMFTRHGEGEFRKCESQALTSLLGQRHLVVATGGGIVTQERNFSLLRQLGFVVGLTASEDVIFERVSRNNKRPLLHTPNPRETVSQLLATRAPLYAAAADFTVDTSKLSHSQVAKTIIHEVQRRFPSASSASSPL